MVWQPGQSGNPKGRPKGERTISHMLRKLGQEVDKDTGMTQQELVCRALYRLALSEHEKATDRLKATEMIHDRIEGKPTQPIADETEHENMTPQQIQERFDRVMSRVVGEVAKAHGELPAD